MFEEFVAKAPQACQIRNLITRKLEMSEQFCETSGTRYDSVSSAGWQSASEDFEACPSLRHP